MPHFLVGGILTAVADIRAHGSGEEHRLLRDESDAGAQVRLRHFADVHPVHEDASMVDVVEPRDQARQRRLPGACAADDGGHLARMRRERDAGEGRFLRAWILERDVLEFDKPALWCR